MEQELPWRLVLTNPGVGAQARSSSQTSKKQISRNEYRFRLQMRVAVTVVVVKGRQELRGSSSNEMLELIPYSPQPHVEKAASLTDLLPSLHLLLRSADLLPSAGSSF